MTTNIASIISYSFNLIRYEKLLWLLDKVTFAQDVTARNEYNATASAAEPEIAIISDVMMPQTFIVLTGVDD